MHARRSEGGGGGGARVHLEGFEEIVKGDFESEAMGLLGIAQLTYEEAIVTEGGDELG
jgi:hypothetical protein